MLTVYTLASKEDKKAVRKFWMQTASLRYQPLNVTWMEPLSLEDIQEAHVLTIVVPKDYLVIGCMSSSFLAALFQTPVARECIQGTSQRIPLLISPCDWNTAPSPFSGRLPLSEKYLSESKQPERILHSAVTRLEGALHARGKE